MIGLASASLKIYVALEACDMRKSFNGLCDIVCQQFADTRLTREALFVFTNKRRNRLKILYFDGSGLWVMAKRLEEGTFSWPSPSKTGQVKLKLAPEAFAMLTDGIDMRDGCRRGWYEDD